MLFPRLRLEKVASEGQLSMSKLEQQMPNPDRPEITNYKQQLFKFQITSTKLQINSNIQYPKHK